MELHKNQASKPNLLTPRLSPWEQEFSFGLAAMLLFWSLLWLLPLQVFQNYGLVVIAGLVLFTFIFRLNWIFYFLNLVVFFSGWEISFAKYEWAKNFAYLSSINAPLGDFVALCLAVFAVLAIVLGIIQINWSKKAFLVKLVLLYSLFLAWALWCTAFAFDHNFGASFKYWIRFMVFSFGAFMVVPAVLINKKETIKNILKIWFGVGVAAAIFGLSSFYFAPQAGLPRVTPFGIGSFAPLGFNHNLIAEVLVAIVPAAFYLWYQESGKNLKNFYLFGSLIILLCALFTLSRAAWITLMAEAIIWVVFNWQKVKVKVYSYAIVDFLLVAILVFVGLYLLVFLPSPIVQSSDSARLAMTDISIFYAHQSPIHGYGPGMFVYILGSVNDWYQEFGDALESHGIWQKLIVEEGYVGALLFLSFLSCLFYCFWRDYLLSSDRNLYLAMVLAAAGAVVFQFFNTSYFSGVMWLPIGLAVSAYLLLVDKKV